MVFHQWKFNRRWPYPHLHHGNNDGHLLPSARWPKNHRLTLSHRHHRPIFSLKTNDKPELVKNRLLDFSLCPIKQTSHQVTSW